MAARLANAFKPSGFEAEGFPCAAVDPKLRSDGGSFRRIRLRFAWHGSWTRHRLVRRSAGEMADLWGLSARAFRARLAKELPSWLDEGLVDASAADRLRERYHLDEEGTSAATVAMYVLGALLIGGGVISFVAWNWDSLHDALKLLLLGSILVGAHVAGTRLRPTRPSLGHALLFFGSVVFGANIGLVAQIFHVQSTWYHGWGAWSVGALVAALAYGSLPTAALSLATATVWAAGVVDEGSAAAGALVPLLLVAVYGGFAWFHRSRALFVLTTIVAVTLASVSAAESAREPAPVVILLACSALLLLALPSVLRATTNSAWCAWSSRIGFAGIATLAYIASFAEVADELGWFEQSTIESWWWLAFAGPVLIAALALLAWGRRFGPLALTEWAGLACTVLFLVGVLSPAPKLTLTVLAHLGLVALAVSAIHTSLHTLRRGPFWLGSLLGVLVIISRFLEFDTGLLLKAFIFTACGVVVLLIGSAFEKRRRAQGATHA